MRLRRSHLWRAVARQAMGPEWVLMSVSADGTLTAWYSALYRGGTELMREGQPEVPQLLDLLDALRAREDRAA